MSFSKTPRTFGRRLGLRAVLIATLLALTSNAQRREPASAGRADVAATTTWPTYGGDPGGTRFSGSTQITRANLDRLHPVWTFHTHAIDHLEKGHGMPSFETTPVLSGETLFATSPYDVVFALDARTGSERWHYDPHIQPVELGGVITSRGVAIWPLTRSEGSSAGFCAQRVFLGTLDARLLALDAVTGRPCSDFGDNGAVDLRRDIHFQNVGFYGVTSPPTVVGNVVIVGSVIGDNQQVDIESGAVRGFDAVTGKQLWLFEPLPWAQTQKVRTGAGNAWSIIAADLALGMVFLPTGSASPDYYGGMRPGDNRDANSIVALDAATGKKIWAFQVVHHDVWDYDIASEPILFTWRGKTPAVAVTTKMGTIFLLDRRTGQPLVPVEERPAPQSDVPGEMLSATQPFQNIPSLSPTSLGAESATTYVRPQADQDACSHLLTKLRYEGMFTPPSLQGSLIFPGNLGGVNWGGAAFDPSTGTLYANSNRSPAVAQLMPRHGLYMTRHAAQMWIQHREYWIYFALIAFALDGLRRRSWRPGRVSYACAFIAVGAMAGRTLDLQNETHPTKVFVLDHFGIELSPQRKSPYLISHRPAVDSNGLSCAPAPWGAITAVNLNSLTKTWEHPLGTMVEGQQTGAINFGGPIVTATGLVITAGAEDNWLRIFDAATGQELRKLALPVPAQATPMTYMLDGKQYVVIAAGGHGDGFTPLGDSIIAFALD